MSNILVTGGAGNVGSALTNGLLKNKNNLVTVVDDLSTGSIDKLPINHERLKFIKADVNVKEEITGIMLSTKFDFVFHYAAYVGVQRTQENPIRVLKDIEGIKNLLSLSKNIGVQRFFFASSSEVYGEPVTIPQHEETTPLNSRVPYAIVKNLGEAFCKSYFQEYNLPYTIFRFFNTYGARQTKDFVMSKFISQAIKNQPITIYGDGTQSRTFCFVKDNIDTTIKVLNENLHINDVINIGGHKIITILELAQKIIKHTNSSSDIIFMPPLKDGDMKRRQPNNTKMLKILDRPLINVDEGIKRILDDPYFIDKLNI